MEIIFRIASVLIGYAFGCIQTSYLYGRYKAGIDIREHGSGSAGMTNVYRTLGYKAGIFVFVCDVLKGAAGFFVCLLIFPSLPYAALYGGIGVVLGHNFPAVLKFKGGKGIASTIGVFLCLSWQVTLPVYAVGLALLFATRYVSLTSLAIVLLFPIGLLIAGYSPEPVAVCAVASAMAFIMHRENIKRLFTGCERKFELKKKPPGAGKE